MTSNTININLKDCHYPIFVNDETFDFESIKSKITQRKITIISNDTVAPLYLNRVTKELQKYNSEIYSLILKDGENYKNQDSWSQILDFLALNNFNRTDLLISLGGGVICDMTGFAAASWMRGIDFLQIPTSLLAQVDASVGGKTGINHPKGKNLIGAFHQPIAVVINTSTLKTLPTRELKSGLGEVIKYGFINQPQFLDWLTINADKINNLDVTILSQLIAKCCHFKAEIIQQDEKESGIRALLNLGHTFGHAIETLTNYQKHSHGEAVAIGIILAARLSYILGNSKENLVYSISEYLNLFNLKYCLPKHLCPHDIINTMRLDKKVINKSHRLILFKTIASCEIVENINEEYILKALTESSA